MKRRTAYGNSHIKFRQARLFRREMTPSEALLWSRLRGNKLMDLHFRRQLVIRGFIVDFYCHKAKIIIEIDGSVHQSEVDADRMRDSILTSLGILVFRVSSPEVENNINGVIMKIQEKCLEQVNGKRRGDYCPSPR
jgi:very-short-patch-repair endonuclease